MQCPDCLHDNIAGHDVCEECLAPLTHAEAPAPAERLQAAIVEDPVAVLEPSPAVSVSLDTPIAEAVDRMRASGQGCVLVHDAEQRLAGIFTERDVLLKIAGTPLDGSQTAVQTVMTPNPQTASRSDSIATVLRTIVSSGLRHVPLTQQGRATAVVTLRDIIEFLDRRLDPVDGPAQVLAHLCAPPKRAPQTAR